MQAQEGGINRRLEESDNEKFYDLYSTLKVIWVIGSRRKTRTIHVADMGEGRNAYRFCWEA
jgi:hypothetical protein